jgi:ABC-type multidrug transport system ATPase subunit
MELIVNNLSKTYSNGVRALDNVTLTIPTGLFGLLGPNGAGKSTLMRTIATLQEPDNGTLRFGEIDILRQKDALRATLGYLPQEFGFYPTLSGEATLDHFALLKGITDRGTRRSVVERLLVQVNLWDARKKNVGGYSGGMKQRLGIAVALVGDPKLIIVDEPTAGLDPTERHRFLNLLSEVGENATVILSTHIVEDVRELCERMAIIARGRVVIEGGPESVISGLAGQLWKKQIGKGELSEYETRFSVVSKRLLGGKTIIFIYCAREPGESFLPVTPDLEDAYFFFTTPGLAEVRT